MTSKIKIIVLLALVIGYSINSFAQGDIWEPAGNHIYSQSTNNAGVGTSRPDAKLTVNGKIHTKELRIDVNVPAPDYVFHKDYKLLPFSELEKFIRRNKHLPDIPSAKEMQREGLTLSEMSFLLLKKTEELTLYIIDHDERIALLEETSNNQKSKK
nr:hypothetical protein [uncultured Draconibacterium sp.]